MEAKGKKKKKKEKKEKMSMRGSLGKTQRSGYLEDELLGSSNKRHRTRGALSKRTLTGDSVLVFFAREDGSADEEEEEESEKEEEQMPQYRPASNNPIEIPVVRTLTDDEMAGTGLDLSQEGDLEPTSDEWYRKLHLVFEIKEQALREQYSRPGSSVRRLVNRSGPVSSTELLLAPSVESRLTKEDHIQVLGKMDVPDVPQERLRAIEGKLEEVEKSYENRPTHFAKYYLHTQWAPQVVVEKPPVEAVPEGQPAPKPKLLIKLTRLQDKR